MIMPLNFSESWVREFAWVYDLILLLAMRGGVSP